MLDTLNANSYSGQIVIDNNISVFNGASGIQSFLNTGGSPNAPIYIRHNTTFGNQTGSVNANPCAEINLAQSLSTTVYDNLVQTNASTACQAAVNLYALAVGSPDSTDQLYGNFLFSAAGNNTSRSGAGFSYGSNFTGSSPGFANPVEPSAPSCGSFASVPACMASVVANYTPSNPAATPYGYQAPSAGSVNDPLFPQWLCNVNLPPGLVTVGCLDPLMDQSEGHYRIAKGRGPIIRIKYGSFSSNFPHRASWRSESCRSPGTDPGDAGRAAWCAAITSRRGGLSCMLVNSKLLLNVLVAQN